MTRKVLLLGGVLPAVQFLRRLAEFVQAIDVVAHVNDAIALSKFADKYLYEHAEDCISVISEWIRNHENESENWVVIPCSEFFIQYVEVFRTAGFDVYASAAESLNVFYDKRLLYRWLSSLNIPVGSFYGLNESFEFNDGKRYIVKSAKNVLGFNAPFKIRIIEHLHELESTRNSIPEKYWSCFIVQQLYFQGKSVSYGGAWVRGVEVASVIVNQVRQYPQGITSFTNSSIGTGDELYVRDIVNKISSNVELHGFIELEFIKTPEGLFPIDLNPRLWGWSNFLFYRYPELPISIINSNAKSLISSPDVFSWSNIWRDIPAILSSQGSLSFKAKLLFDLCRASKKDFICFRDIKPEFSAVINRLARIKR